MTLWFKKLANQWAIISDRPVNTIIPYIDLPIYLESTISPMSMYNWILTSRSDKNDWLPYKITVEKTAIVVSYLNINPESDLWYNTMKLTIYSINIATIDEYTYGKLIATNSYDFKK